MFWNDLDGTILLNKVFSKPVEISDIDIFDIKIDREGPTVTIGFDLIGKLPENPPEKWVKGYNKCRCGINCGGVTSINIEGIAVNMLAKIEIKKENGHNKVIINGSNFRLNLECMHIQFMGPSVYISK
ncbi:Imm50 family immunity protein [Photorhabdus luminescens]|uniref:Imm50 family immunity protein n=1 Tax=Photorhabdus luminescens TaxID=29488 RepID=UPI00223EFEAC|nr:Imm50 family immunity protein [Photorhabdus luminescens]MCW7764665.1 immunity 50 family protein [Photorhabdus luminescens subsp. venezuelensis]